MKRDQRILIVEDNPLVARAIEEAGAVLQLACECATDGWDAIEKLETGDYDAIFIDADVPRQSGFGVLTYLREEVGGELAHVIVMTSSDHDEMQRKVGSHLRVVAKDQAAAEITRFFGKN